MDSFCIFLSTRVVSVRPTHVPGSWGQQSPGYGTLQCTMTLPLPMRTADGGHLASLCSLAIVRRAARSRCLQTSFLWSIYLSVELPGHVVCISSALREKSALFSKVAALTSVFPVVLGEHVAAGSMSVCLTVTAFGPLPTHGRPLYFVLWEVPGQVLSPIFLLTFLPFLIDLSNL